MTADLWSPERYEKFRPEREQPFYDLLQLVEQRPVRRAVDLGCGTGRLTRELHRTLNAEATVGVDSSPAMLERARSLDEPGLGFVLADMRGWKPDAPFDVVFCNAALQWIDDHHALFRRLRGLVASEGTLAVQMPANFDHPSHTTAASTALEQPFSEATGGYTRVAPVLKAEEYAELLYALGFRDIHVRLQVYPHELASSSDVVEWVRGTLLTDYEVRMPAAMFEEYVRRYRERLLGTLGRRQPYLYAFKRLLLRARAPA
ncbi:MAG: methyltransferase domain-containing protein [Candidatus Dormibacteria bacterium]